MGQSALASKITFKSSVEGVIFIPLTLVLFAVTAFIIAEGIWAAALPVGVLAGFLIYICRNTIYELTPDKKLLIKSGFLYHKEIYIQSIKRIRKTKNHIASPALSGDRIEIQFNRYERVMISPKAQKEFVEQLKKINPSINIMGTSKSEEIRKKREILSATRTL